MSGARSHRVRKLHVDGFGSHSRSRARCRAPANVRDHFAPGRGQDDADRKAAALRRGHPARGYGQVAQERPARHVRLDGGREAARHLGNELGDAVRVRCTHDQPARYAGPRGFLGGHLSRADGRRRRGHGDRCRQGCRSADDQAARGVPAARNADHHVHQQAGSRSARTARAARRGGIGAPHRLRADQLAGRHGQALSRRVPSFERATASLRARRGAHCDRYRVDCRTRQFAPRRAVSG